MREMVLVGRGGEGVVLASRLLADTLALAGFRVQSFPEFKAERRGAPISAFLRWDGEPIRRRYKVRDCDVLAVLSPAPPSPQALAAVRPGGLVVLNRETRWPHTGPFALARVPAARIAEEHGILSPEGRPLGNLAVLGACVRLLAPEALPFLERAIRAHLAGAAAEANVAAARAGYESCVRQRALAGDAPAEAHATSPLPLPPRFAVTSTDSLAIRTGAWALEQPLVGERCSACGVCALFCPEGAISRADGSLVVDLAHCKGCGICASVCPVRGALALEEVAA